MDYSDELEAIFNRIDEGTCTERDRQILRERLLQADPALVSQLGKYNVSIAEGREVHIGDRITIEFNEQAMAQVIAVLQTSGWRGDGGVYQDLEVLETVDLDSHLVERVNQRLKLLESLRDQARLSDTQKVELQEIQKQVRTVNTLNQELKSMARRAKRLLQDMQVVLSSNLQNLKSTSSGLIVPQGNVAKLSSQVDALEAFIAGLDDSKRAAQWLAQMAPQLKQAAGKRALSQFPEIRDRATPKELDDFDFSVEQFLEQVVHALEWGDYSIFDAPGIPLVFDCTSLYIAVFEDIKARLPRRSQPAQVIEQVEECLDYLLDCLIRLY